MHDVDRYVTIALPGERDPVPAGVLTLIEERTRTLASRFSYGIRYQRRPDAIAVDPVSLPLEAAASRRDSVPIGELVLFGALRDATPDAWGRRVIENKLRAEPGSLPESAYLDHAGPHRAGALDVRLALDSANVASPLPTLMDLDHLVDAADRVQEGMPVPAHLELFFTGAPTLGGARPKAVVLSEGRQWIAKFPAPNDPFDVALVERATLELARVVGLDVPATRAITIDRGRHVMLIERFDRADESQGFAKRHMISALTALGIDEQESPTMRYADIARALESLVARGRVHVDRVELFKRMVFNILVSNDDDHLRNHALVHDAGLGGWRLSPLYDVVPRASLASERFLHLGVGPSGRVSTLDNAFAGCAQFGLSPPEAAAIIDELARHARAWKTTFETLGVPGVEIDRVANAFRRPDDIGMTIVARARRG